MSGFKWPTIDNSNETSINYIYPKRVLTLLTSTHHKNSESFSDDILGINKNINNFLDDHDVGFDSMNTKTFNVGKIVFYVVNVIYIRYGSECPNDKGD